MTTVQWGLLSTANIGRLMVTAARRSGTARFVAVASRDGNRSSQFAADLGLEESFASYEALLACDRVDAVYIALPNSMHTEWAIKVLKAGKHVLCEKPFALTAAEVRQAFDAAAEARRVCAEGFMYRYHPQTLLAQLDVGMDLPRRDELELIGSEGTIVVPDPWLCRAEAIELRRDGHHERLPVDPDGTYALAHDDYDVYRIELDAVSVAISGGTELPFGRDDAVDQARVLQALIRSAEIAAPVTLS